MWGFTAEEIQAFVAAHAQQTGATSPVLVVKENFRCDTCKRFMSPLDLMVNQSGVYCHLTEKCLTKFAIKHNWEHLKFDKQQLVTSEGEI